MKRRFRRLEHCRFVQIRPGRPRRVGGLTATAIDVPHARDRRFRTFAWKVSAGEATVVYASDVAETTSGLRRFVAGASLLVIHGAMWGRRLFSHLTINEELPQLCEWRVERILLTQIGRTLPPHERAQREVADLCTRAAPAYDGLEVAV